MSRLILYAGRRFGRFAVLLLVAPVALICYFWLSLLDTHPRWVLSTAIIMLPMALLAVAFLIAMLFAGFRRSKVKGVDRSAAPGLWSAWEGLVGPSRAARTVIVIDDELNASVRMERSLFGLARSRVILTVGIPLLAVTDQKALVAILAHENAHVINKDTNGSLRFAEFEKTFAVAFEYASPESTISGRLLFTALGWLSKSMQKENTRLSREAELAADRQAAKSSHAAEIAQSLLLMAAAVIFFDERVYKPLEREVLGAMQPPRPPLERLLEAARELSDRTLLNACARKAVEQPDDKESSHPSWAQSLLALGFAEPPEIEPVTVTALSTLLTADSATQLIRDFDQAWTKKIARRLER